MAANYVIETNKLTKVYRAQRKETLALDGLTLAVQPGEVFGFLGPNGAGKTTTIRLLLDLIRPTNGGAKIFGKDVRENSVELHKDIGFLPGELALWKSRTGKQVINYIASVRGGVQAQTSYAAQLADRLKFDMTKRVGDYSSGNKRKLGLILALMHQPKLLILDEPTSGLDPL
ncbi:MAG: ABC transporter ATP-binding protein, partial [Anaerolineae bacterium]|nr:ABC transporter ATP-binding protein [Anaerolineae bacterium]